MLDILLVVGIFIIIIFYFGLEKHAKSLAFFLLCFYF